MFLKKRGRSSSAEHQLPKLDRRVQFPSPAVLLVIGLLGYWVIGLSGCASLPYQPPPVTAIPKPISGPGIYHEVRKGDTLWGISRIYDIDLSDIINANSLSQTATKISPGQRIFIPGAKTPQKAATEKIKLYERERFIWPLDGEIISYFGQELYGTQNKGLDIKARKSSEISAAKGGKVVFTSDNQKGIGRVVIIDHLDGFSSLYARNSENLVKAGDYISQGQVIARSGSTGRGPAYSLHFEIRRQGRPQNPLYYLP